MEDAIKLLKAYSLKNPRNPTPFRELYSLYLKDFGDIKLAIENLEKFCELCPSDDLCLDLCKMKATRKFNFPFAENFRKRERISETQSKIFTQICLVQ